MTELSPLLRRLVDSMFSTAQEQFREGNEVLPQATLLGEDDEGLVFVPVLTTMDIFGTRNGKPVLPVLIQGVYGKILAERPALNLLGIALLMDTWIEKVSTFDLAKNIAEGRFIRPSQKPDSQEVILVQLTVHDKTFLYQWPYVRVGKEVLFSGQPEENEKSGALIPGLWPVY